VNHEPFSSKYYPQTDERKSIDIIPVGGLTVGILEVVSWVDLADDGAAGPMQRHKLWSILGMKPIQWSLRVAERKREQKDRGHFGFFHRDLSEIHPCNYLNQPLQ
jgi:hypothetical protein